MHQKEAVERSIGNFNQTYRGHWWLLLCTTLLLSMFKEKRGKGHHVTRLSKRWCYSIYFPPRRLNFVHVITWMFGRQRSSIEKRISFGSLICFCMSFISASLCCKDGAHLQEMRESFYKSTRHILLCRGFSRLSLVKLDSSSKKLLQHIKREAERDFDINGSSFERIRSVIVLCTALCFLFLLYNLCLLAITFQIRFGS